MKNSRIIIIPIITLFLFCTGDTGGEHTSQLLPPLEGGAQAVSFGGEKLFSSEPAEQNLEKLKKAAADLEADPGNVEMHIWHGRRMAYTGDYRKAINIYTNAIEQFPDDARLYRHRGHRFISIRMLDAAIDDLTRASNLIEGTEDRIEPDGMPNARNIPVSSLHTNTWYHLGLAYYLKNDMENALAAYRKCREASMKPDNVVSASHWLYMILKRLGRDSEAAEILTPINAEMDIIENMAYHELLLFYKGELEADDLLKKVEEGSAGSATLYGVGNWYYYNDDVDQAKQIYEGILTGSGWAAFGYIAAEADMQIIK